MISSTSNKKVSEVVELQKKSRVRNKQGLFVIEGRKMFMEAPREWIVQTYAEESIWNSAEDSLKDKLRAVNAESVSAEVMKKMCDTQTPQGILALVRQKEYELKDLLSPGKTPLLLIIEQLQDPGNLGTLIRTGEGAGVTGIVLSKGTVDLYNPKVIRASMGSIYRMPVCQVENLDTTIGEMKSRGIAVYAAHLKGQKYHDAFDYTKPCGFMIGNEGNGLTDHAASLADSYIRIPMEGSVESLNAAIAGTLLIYEANRQRRNQ